VKSQALGVAASDAVPACPAEPGTAGPLAERCRCGRPTPPGLIYRQVQRCGRRSRLSTLAVHGSGLLSGGISAST
jgi:hypothetical protein